MGLDVVSRLFRSAQPEPWAQPAAEGGSAPPLVLAREATDASASDVLRTLADALDAAATLDALPARAVPVSAGSAARRCRLSVGDWKLGRSA